MRIWIFIVYSITNHGVKISPSSFCLPQQNDQNKSQCSYKMFARSVNLRVFTLKPNSLICRPINSKSDHQKMPSGLSRKLIHGSHSKKRLPDVQNSLSLARNLAQAEVTCEEFVNKIVISYQHLLNFKHLLDIRTLKDLGTSHTESSLQ